MAMFGWIDCQLVQQSTTQHDWFEELTSIIAVITFYDDAGNIFIPSTFQYRVTVPTVTDLSNWSDITNLLGNFGTDVISGHPKTRFTVPGFPLYGLTGQPERREILFAITDKTLPGQTFYEAKVFMVYRPNSGITVQAG